MTLLNNKPQKAMKHSLACHPTNKGTPTALSQNTIKAAGKSASENNTAAIKQVAADKVQCTKEHKDRMGKVNASNCHAVLCLNDQSAED